MVKKIAGLLFVVTLIAAMTTNCQNNAKPAVDGDKLREYAGDLVNRSLYKQAIEVYTDYLAKYQIDDEELIQLTEEEVHEGGSGDDGFFDTSGADLAGPEIEPTKEGK